MNKDFKLNSKSNDFISQAVEELERLEMCYQGSKGCSITLAEWMDNDNMEILEDFLKAKLQEAYQNGCADVKNAEAFSEGYKRGKQDFKKQVEGMEKEMKETHMCRFNDGDCDCDCYMEALKDIINKLNNKSNEEVL